MKRAARYFLGLSLACAAVADEVRIDPVGHWGGQAFDVVVKDSTAYVGIGVSLLAVDVSNPAAPRLLSRTVLPDLVYHLAVSGDRLYVANWTGGLRIFDISDATRPVDRGVLRTAVQVSEVAPAGDFAFLLGDYWRLYVVDASNPDDPVGIAKLPIESTNGLGSIALSGRYAYIVAPDSFFQWFLVVDVSDPARPFVVSADHTSRGRAVAVSGPYAYLATTFGLRVFDVSDTAAPFLVATYYAGNTGGYTAAVSVYKSVAAITRIERGLDLIDITDPANPTQLAQYGTSQYVGDVQLIGDRAYIADGKEGLLILDVADPTAPVELGRLPEGSSPASVTVAGHFAYMTDMTFDEINGLRILNIRRPAEPVPVGRADTIGRPKTAVVREPFMYVAAYDSGLEIFDVSDRANPVAVSAYYTDGGARAVALSDGLALVGSTTGLEVVDITNPEQPKRVGLYADLQPDDIEVKDGYAYVVQGGPGILDVVDLSDPALPVRVNRFQPRTGATSLDLHGDFLYMGGSVLYVFDVSNPPNLPSPAQRNIGFVRHLVASPPYVYARVDFYGLKVVDVSDPAAPTEVGGYRLSSNDLRGGIAAFGRYVLHADNFVGLRIFSVGLSHAPPQH